jgi:GNAT superfamily N-acetyltransferase
LAYIEKEAVACGCFRPGAEGIVEIKRMYVEPVWRGNRIGSLVLGELERWALEEGNRMSRLETGSNQPEAIAVYERSGYKRILNYPPYDAINESICMAKEIH